MKRIQLFSFAVFLFVEICATAQENRSTDKLIEYNTVFPGEKLYVHLDQPYHLAGEILWFKVYCVNATTHTFQNLSSVVYLEVINKQGDSVLKSIVELKSGTGHGSFYLPSSLTSGNYTLMAYTNWMKNFDPAFFFQTHITIVNTLTPTNKSKTSTDLKLDAQFFPEGGNLVAEVKNRIGFKITDESGRGIDSVHGIIINQKNDTLTSFAPLKFGIGSLSLTPSINDQLSALIKWGEQIFRISLPQIQNNGFAISVNEKDHQSIRICVYSGYEESGSLLIHTRHSLKHFQKISLTNKHFEISIDKKHLDDGISTITLFNSNNQPVCERLYFKAPALIDNLEIQTSQRVVPRRYKSTISLVNKKNNLAHVSLSIYKKDTITFKSNIACDLLLKSDLVGEIEEPWYYLSNEGLASGATDNLMLTHGWRRFVWNHSYNLPYKFLPELYGHLIQGKFQVDQEYPRTIFLSIPGKTSNLYMSSPDSTGSIMFQVKNLPIENIMIQPGGDLLLGNFSLISPFTESKQNLTLGSRIENLDIKAITSRSIQMQAMDYFHEASVYFNFKKDSIEKNIFFGHSSETYLLDDYVRFNSLEEIFREYVKGVSVKKLRGEFQLVVKDKENEVFFKDNPLILVDGVPFSDVEKILSLDQARVRKINVVTNQYYFGEVIFPGIINIETFGGDLGGLSLGSSNYKLEYQAFQLKREFYSPKYSIRQEKAERKPDHRYLLYWGPTLEIDANSGISIDLFSSDVTGDFIVVLEGLYEDGTPVHSTQLIKVSD